MLRGAINRIALSGLILVGLSFIAFGMIHLAGGNPIAALTGGRPATPSTVEALEARYHLDSGFFTQYLAWMGHAIHGDFGESISLQEQVSSVVTSRVGITLELVVGALVIIAAVGIPIGLWGALYPLSLVARVSRVISLGGLATPSFLTAYILLFAFTVKLQWLPAFGVGSDAGGRFEALILPWATLSLAYIGQTAEVTRETFAEVLRSEYIEFARAKGLSMRAVVVRHAARSAFPSLLTIFGLQFGAVLAATVVVEQIFGLGGLGQALIDAITGADYPLIQGLVLIYGATFLAVNLFVDLGALAVDPRARTRATSR